MKDLIIKIIRGITPPFILKIRRKIVRPKYGYFGNYNNWQEALKDSEGYDSPAILDKVKNALLKVKNGEAVYERDSVIFEKIEYSWPVTSALLWISSENGGLDLIDFGGSLGSSYYQNIGFLKHIPNLKWNIVEQEKFVDCGKKNFENNQLKFFYSINDSLKESKSSTLLISSVLPYLEKPYDFIKEIMTLDFKYIIFDRTPFLPNEDRLTIQKAPPEICKSSYPAWFFNREKFLGILNKQYDVIAEFDALGGKRNIGNIESDEKGFIFKKK